MYTKELDFLKNTLQEAYFQCCQSSVSVFEKAEFDVVTNVDRAIERHFSASLAHTFPGDRLLGEEFSSDAMLSDRTWILDPIDGTYNFSTGSRQFGLQAALWDRGDLRVSVIYLPAFSELYEAQEGKGAFLNGKRIFVSKRAPKDAIVSFGDFPHKRPEDAMQQMKIMERSIPRIARLRMFGAASVDFAHLASGKTEGVVLYTKNKWDIAPGWLLSREAGACLFGHDGEPYSFHSRAILACNHEDLYQVMMKDKI